MMVQSLKFIAASLRLLAIIGISIALFCSNLIINAEAKPAQTRKAASSTRSRAAMMLAEIEVHGVSCIGCMRRIERGLRTHKGVKQAEVSAAPGGVLAKITYDAGTVKLDELLALIKQESDDFQVRKNEKVTSSK